MTATKQTGVGRQAIAAIPLFRNKKVRGVGGLHDSLDDVQANVELIRRRSSSRARSRSSSPRSPATSWRGRCGPVKRLERAAREVAAGDFSHAIPLDSDDELGQLASAFDDMQRQLARLDTARKQFIASRRTSCARRSSRSAASSSCSRTRSSTRRRARQFL